MKKTKNLIITVSLLLGLAIAFMASGHKTENANKPANSKDCWIEPTFTWSGDCVYVDNNASYVIDMDIIDICIGSTLFNGDPQVLPTTQTSTSFCVPNQLCNIDETQKCFKVVVSLAKVNNSTQQIICSTQKVFGPYNCEELSIFDQTTHNIPLN